MIILGARLSIPITHKDRNDPPLLAPALIIMLGARLSIQITRKDRNQCMAMNIRYHIRTDR
jgi:hypothetical protein